MRSRKRILSIVLATIILSTTIVGCANTAGGTPSDDSFSMETDRASTELATAFFTDYYDALNQKRYDDVCAYYSSQHYDTADMLKTYQLGNDLFETTYQLESVAATTNNEDCIAAIIYVITTSKNTETQQQTVIRRKYSYALRKEADGEYRISEYHAGVNEIISIGD